MTNPEIGPREQNINEEGYFKSGGGPSAQAQFEMGIIQQPTETAFSLVRGAALRRKLQQTQLPTQQTKEVNNG